MSRLPIIDALKEYNNKKYNYYAMPGHKMGVGFTCTEEGKKLLNNIIQYDVTEVDGVDNLHSPKGVIKESQDLLAKYYNSKKSYYLVNGSTSGNMIMIFSVFNENDKIIVERNCHKSVYNSIMLRKLKPIYIKNEINEKYDAPLSINKEHLFELIKENQDAKGILLTYPNYYGVCTNLEDIINEAKKYKMKVLIDGAHGAHFGINSMLPKNALEFGADIVVTSAHKTLPSLTQTAFLHVGDKSLINKLDFYVGVFSTTSPSYIFLATMEYSRYYLEEYGIESYSKLIDLCEEYRLKIEELRFFHILCENDIIKKNNNVILVDKTRYVINVPKGYSGNALQKYLIDNGIQPEMHDSRNVVLIFGCNTTKQDMEKLYTALKNCNTEILRSKYIKPKNCLIPSISKLPWEVLDAKKCSVKIEEGIGKICGQAIIPYPPGIPIIMAGEVVTSNVIDNIRYYFNQGATLLGMDGDNIVVIEE